ncbi:hypothetical protein JB92DRAFT_2736028, partial [Gautieria morchelliformis]
SQGQTILTVIVDIATPPTAGLTAFNAYVQLSRSSEDQWLEKLDEETRQWWEDRRQRRSSVSKEQG